METSVTRARTPGVYRNIVIAIVGISAFGSAGGAARESQQHVGLTSSFAANQPDEANEQWSISIDNDLFSSRNEDRDYTGGLSLTVAGPGNMPAPFRRIQRLLVRDRESSGDPSRQHAMQFGLLVFTPDDIGTSRALPDDRPYANLVYLSAAAQSFARAQTALRQSRLTVGVLGSGVAREIQTAIHSRSGAKEPRGYGHQVSDGGELTVQYAISRHRLLSANGFGSTRHDVKLTLDGAAGFLTEAAVGLDVRWGRIGTPWWSSVSNYADYTSRPAPVAPGTSGRDFYVFAGAKLHMRAYNAFLQGQFKSSDVVYRSSELHHVVRELWIGVSADFDRFRVGFAFRYQSSEIRSGTGSRSMRWSGITFTRRIR